MPEELVLSHLAKVGFDYASAETDDTAVIEKLAAIANKFKVSIQSLSFRIANLAV
jgi:hypothetical protein